MRASTSQVGHEALVSTGRGAPWCHCVGACAPVLAPGGPVRPITSSEHGRTAGKLAPRTTVSDHQKYLADLCQTFR